MPMSGVDILRAIKSSSSGSQIKIAMLSVMGQEKVIRECKQLGAVDYITKPFDNEDLVRRVRALLKG